MDSSTLDLECRNQWFNRVDLWCCAGFKYQAASKNGDVIHLSWLLDCVTQKALLSVGPKYVANSDYYFLIMFLQ